MAEKKTDNKIFEFASCDDTFIYKLVCFVFKEKINFDFSF